MNQETKKKWRKIEGPKPWQPREGESCTLEGFYGGLRTITGKHGEYEVIIVYTEYGAFSVSGCKALTLIRCAGVLNREDRVRFTYLGELDMGNGNRMKDYELHVLR